MENLWYDVFKSQLEAIQLWTIQDCQSAAIDHDARHASSQFQGSKGVFILVVVAIAVDLNTNVCCSF